jgi:hypothetical protein
MGPPVGRARSPPGLGPHNCRGPGDTLPQKRPETRLPGLLGSLSACSSAIFHIHEPCALNTISNIIGFAVAAGHRLLTRTRELEDRRMARTRAHPPRRLATARGESEVTEARRPASPTPPPRRGLIFWGVPPAVGIVGPEDPRSKSLQSWREGWGLLWAVSSITCDHCFEAPGSQAH